MKNLNILLAAQIKTMAAISGNTLFKVSPDGLWDIYLSSFPGDPIFRSEGEHNCNTCRQFIDRYAGIIAIGDDNKVMSLWDLDITKVPDEYKNSIQMLAQAVHSRPIDGIFVQTIEDLYSYNYEKKGGHWEKGELFRLGLDSNIKTYTKEEVEKFGAVVENKVYTFNHFSIQIPRKFMTIKKDSIASIQSVLQSSHDVFKKGLEQIETDTVETIQEIIRQGSLMGSVPYETKVVSFLAMKKKYDSLPVNKRDAWTWRTSAEIGMSGRFANELIGELAFDIQKDGLVEAVQKWNKRVDPANWMKTKSPITQKQIDEATKWLRENNYEESFSRRFAVLDDIQASEIKYLKADSGELPKGLSVFDVLKPSAPGKKVDESKLGATEIDIDKFMEDILPMVSGCEVLMKPEYSGNMVSLLTSSDPTSKPIFKWDNNYSWNYSGGLAGKSMIKNAVKSVGGRIEAPIRFSIMWNEDGQSILDLDAHATETTGTGSMSEIYFGSYNKDRSGSNISPGSGQLDIDMISPKTIGIENITWGNGAGFEEKMKTLRKIKLYVVNFSNSPAHYGSKAELEIFGDAFLYNLPDKFVKPQPVATIEMNQGKVVNIEHHLPYTKGSGREIWGLPVQEWAAVKLMCLSPNYWTGANGSGNKHYMFFLEGAECPDLSRTFHNEFLKPDLLSQKRVLEVLGDKTKIEPKAGAGELNGLGFNSTVRDSVIVRYTRKDSGDRKFINKINF